MRLVPIKCECPPNSDGEGVGRPIELGQSRAGIAAQ